MSSFCLKKGVIRLFLQSPGIIFLLLHTFHVICVIHFSPSGPSVLTYSTATSDDPQAFPFFILLGVFLAYFLCTSSTVPYVNCASANCYLLFSTFSSSSKYSFHILFISSSPWKACIIFNRTHSLPRSCFCLSCSGLVEIDFNDKYA